ncbi:radical SAM/SPASM domain-containing protein [Vibrio sp.]|uniref:radical SAM/SPASM domain-containing protein n=1 Tax=Vibrio sp. TaxID=678 RepID=UPI00312003D6
MKDMFFIGPFNADLNLTNACNLACSHCHSSSGKSISGELDTIEVMDAIYQLYEIGVHTLTIAGGEPFVRPDIFDILSFANNLSGLSVVVITNGTKIFSNDFIKKMATMSNVRINVSVDGSNYKIFNVYRRWKNDNSDSDELFNKVVSNIKTGIKSDLDIGISFVLSSHNMDDLRTAYKLMVDEIGTSSFTAIKFISTGYGEAMHGSMDFDYRSWANLMVSLHKEKQRGSLDKLFITTVSIWEIYLPLVDADFDIQEIGELWGLSPALHIPGYSSHHELGDVSGVMSVCIDSNGDVYPSVLSIGSDYLCGNIKESPLRHIWNNSDVLNKIRKMTLLDISDKCTTCYIGDTCGGGFRFRQHDISLPDTHCPRINGEG